MGKWPYISHSPVRTLHPLATRACEHTHTLTHASRGALFNATDLHLLLMLPLTGQGSQTYPLVFFFIAEDFVRCLCQGLKGPVPLSETEIYSERQIEGKGREGMETRGMKQVKSRGNKKWGREEQGKRDHPPVQPSSEFKIDARPPKRALLLSYTLKNKTKSLLCFYVFPSRCLILSTAPNEWQTGGQ